MRSSCFSAIFFQCFSAIDGRCLISSQLVTSRWLKITVSCMWVYSGLRERLRVAERRWQRGLRRIRVISRGSAESYSMFFAMDARCLVRRIRPIMCDE